MSLFREFIQKRSGEKEKKPYHVNWYDYELSTPCQRNFTAKNLKYWNLRIFTRYFSIWTFDTFSPNPQTVSRCMSRINQEKPKEEQSYRATIFQSFHGKRNRKKPLLPETVKKGGAFDYRNLDFFIFVHTLEDWF